MEDYYSALNIPRTASLNEVKAAFKKLSLKHHPDKQESNTDYSETNQFIKIYEAWNTLSDPNLRIIYDKKLADREALQCLPVDEELSLGEMIFDKNEDIFRKTCRCGGEYVIAKCDLDAEDTYINCDSCSLCIKLHVDCLETKINGDTNVAT